MSEDVKSLDEVFERLKTLIKDLNYGSITLIVQDGKIIQIDKTDKIRL